MSEPEDKQPPPVSKNDKSGGVKKVQSKYQLTLSANFWRICTCVIALVALFVSVTVLWRQTKFIQPLNSIQTLVEQQGQTVTRNASEQSALLEQLQKKITENAKRVLKVSKDLKRVEGNSEDSWYLAETEYFMRAAVLQLQTNRDVPGAMRLLKQANYVLGSINEYALFPVKKGLEEDIAALNGAPVVDITRLWLQLNATITQVESLPLITPKGFESSHKTLDSENQLDEGKNQDNGGNTFVSDWKHRLKKVLLDSWHFFSGQFYLRVRSNDQPSLLLPKKEETQLKRNIQLMLTQAQQALLMRNEEIYQKSLENASQWINTWFHNNSTEAKALLAKLDFLHKAEINPKLPNISHGLEALETYNAVQVSSDSQENLGAVENMVPEKDKGDQHVESSSKEPAEKSNTVNKTELVEPDQKQPMDNAQNKQPSVSTDDMTNKTSIENQSAALSSHSSNKENSAGNSEQEKAVKK